MAAPKLPFWNPLKNVLDTAASAALKIVRAKVDVRFVSTLAKTAARSTVVVGIVGGPIKCVQKHGIDMNSSLYAVILLRDLYLLMCSVILCNTAFTVAS